MGTLKTEFVAEKRQFRRFNRVSIDDIDFVRRTLVCNVIKPKTPPTPSTPECYEELTVEEEAQPDTTESTSESTRAQRLYDELECLKRRIQMIQLAIKRRRERIETRDTTTIPTEREESQDVGDGDVESYNARDAFCARFVGSDEQFIAALQKDQHKMQCQLHEQILSMREVRKILREKRKQSCQRVKMMRQLEHSIDEFSAWKNLVEREISVCDERYEYITHVKAMHKKADHIIKQRFQCILAQERHHLKSCVYVWNKAELIAELSNVLQFAEELRAMINNRIEKIQEIMSNVFLINYEDLDESDLETSLFYSHSTQYLEKVISTSSEDSETTMASGAYDLGKTNRKLKILKTVENFGK